MKDELQMHELTLRDAQARNYIHDYRASKGTWWDDFEKQLLFDAVMARTGKAILDAGCGVGRLTIPLAAMGCSVESLDFSPESIRILSEMSYEFQNRIHAQVHDLTQPLPLSPDSVDGIVSCQAVQHIPVRLERVAAWNNMFKIAKPGARLATMSYHAHGKIAEEGQFENGLFYHRYTSDDLSSELTEAGWSLVSFSIWYRRSWRNWSSELVVMIEKTFSALRLFDARGNYILAVAYKPFSKPA